MNDQHEHDFWGEDRRWRDSGRVARTENFAHDTTEPGRVHIAGSGGRRSWRDAITQSLPVTKAVRDRQAALEAQRTPLYDIEAEPEQDPAHPIEAYASLEDWGDDGDWDDGWEQFAPQFDGATGAQHRPQPDIEAEPQPAEPARSGHIDPLLARLSAGLVVLTLAVPALMAFGGNSDEPAVVAGDLPRTVDTALDAAIGALDPSLTAQTVSPTAPAAEQAVASATASGDGAASPNLEATDDTADADVTETAEPAADRAAADPAADLEPTAAGLDLETAPSTGLPTIDEHADASDEATRVEPECPVEYEIAAGDYWLRIADESGVALGKILSLNGATERTPLYPGTTICLPQGATIPSPPPTSTTVKPTTPTTVKPATTTTTPPTTAPPATNVSQAEAERIIRQVWPDDIEDRAVEIARRESNLIPTAKNYCCYGLFQIYYSAHDSWLSAIGVTSAAQLYDARVNAYAALVLYNRAGGFGPWS